MDSLVNKQALEQLYGSVQDRIYSKPPMFHLLVTHYKTPQYLDKCLTSIFSQRTNTPFYVHLVDDASEMQSVTELLDKWSKQEPLRLRVIRQTERQNKARNLFHLLKTAQFNPEDILGIIDGDDWFAHDSVLERVVREYQEKDCWVTYGTYAGSNGDAAHCTIPITTQHLYDEAQGKGFRQAPWIFSHFFTAKAFLWLNVKEDILRFEGKEEFRAPADQLFNFPIAEMASSKHISHISDILYIYNNESSLNDCKTRPEVQSSYDVKNRMKSPYKPIQRPSLDFLVIMPCRGRFPLLKTTVRRFKEEHNSPIVLVEHSEKPEYKDYAKQQGIGWIYVPMIGSATSPLGQFNRGLCFDIGFLYGPESNYYICHDNDLLVPVGFWDRLRQNLQTNQVLQTYSDRFVWQTNPDISELLIETPSWFHQGFQVERDCSANPPGAKGGSITVSRGAYLAVGGHDPHLFFGYAAEDAFFWSKLELFFTIGFAENPRIPLVHLWHPNAANLNPFKHEMDILFHMFNSVDTERKREYCIHKSEQFQQMYKSLRGI